MRAASPLPAAKSRGTGILPGRNPGSDGKLAQICTEGCRSRLGE